MKNRSILARMGAKKKKTPKKEKKKELKGQILAKDPETKKVMHTFDNFEDVEAAEFRATNVKSALKTGNKYKGFLWGLSE